MNLLVVVLWNLVAPPAQPLEQLAWLSGCWEHRTERRVTLEMWSPPDGGLMVGGSRTVADGRAQAFEHLRIFETADGFVYTAIPSGQSETDFTSTSVSEDGFVVENPEHDFPTRITYRRTAEDRFVAIVEGPEDDGSMGGFQNEFRRVQCEGSQ